VLELGNIQAIVVAERDDEFGIVKEGFPSSSAIHRASVFSVPSISKVYEQSKPDILIAKTQRADQKGLLLLENVVESTKLPVLWFVDSDPQHFAASAIRTGITTFVVGGLISSRIESLVCVTLERHRLFSTLQQQIENQSEELNTRKIVERAKGMLMQSKRLSEEEAYKTMRSMAMNQGKTLKDIAIAVMDMSDLLS